MTAHTPTLHVRVDDDIKEQATQALTAMGLSMSDAVRPFLRCVVLDQAFPSLCNGSRIREGLEGRRYRAGGWAIARRKHD